MNVTIKYKFKMRYLSFIFASILFSTVLCAENETDKCKYCGSSAYGSCTRSPIKIHVHIGDSEKCVYCGSHAYGSCTRSPYKIHKHGHGQDKCVWCGSRSVGSCTRSPSGRHEK